MSATTPRHGVQFSVGRYLFNLQFTTKAVFHGIIYSKNFAEIMRIVLFTLFSRFPQHLLLNSVGKTHFVASNNLLFSLQRNLHLKTPDGEVITSIFRLIGSHRDRAREFEHASRLHGSGYKSTGLNHRVDHTPIDPKGKEGEMLLFPSLGG
jgi:hypothetical protein